MSIQENEDDIVLTTGSILLCLLVGAVAALPVSFLLIYLFVKWL